MKCDHCGAEWTLPDGAAAPEACPFCGAPLRAADEPEPETLEECLLRIVWLFGADTFHQTGRTLGLFSDLAPDLDNERRLLESFLNEGGGEAYFAALSKSSADQRAAYERTVHRLMTDRYIAEPAARRVCAAFWRAIGGAEQAIGAPEPPKPEKKPEKKPKPAAKAAPKKQPEPAAPDPIDAKAQYRLGEAYRTGTGRTRDPAQAAEWYRKAAAQGYADAQYRLGECLENGTGVKKDLTAAAEWYRKAAEQDHLEACYRRGLCLETGSGVDKNPTAALMWYRTAAQKGHANAQYRLGKAYLLGIGTAKNAAQAENWLRKAAAQGRVTPAADLLELLPSRPKPAPKTDVKPKPKQPAAGEKPKQPAAGEKPKQQPKPAAGTKVIVDGETWAFLFVVAASAGLFFFPKWFPDVYESAVYKWMVMALIAGVGVASGFKSPIGWIGVAVVSVAGFFTVFYWMKLLFVTYLLDDLSESFINTATPLVSIAAAALLGKWTADCIPDQKN